MILSDIIHPRLSLYYIGAIVLEKLETHNNKTMIDVFEAIKETEKISFKLFLFALDWLYLIDLVYVDDKGVVRKCY